VFYAKLWNKHTIVETNLTYVIYKKNGSIQVG